jgi:hypothetical protein
MPIEYYKDSKGVTRARIVDHKPKKSSTFKFYEHTPKSTSKPTTKYRFYEAKKGVLPFRVTNKKNPESGLNVVEANAKKNSRSADPVAMRKDKEAKNPKKTTPKKTTPKGSTGGSNATSSNSGGSRGSSSVGSSGRSSSGGSKSSGSGGGGGGSSSLEAMAKKLSDAEFAGILEQLDINQQTNRKQYENYVPQRQDSLAKQIGSDRLATEITQNSVGGLKGEAMDNFRRAAEANAATQAVRKSTQAAQNANTLTNYEREMRAYGLSPERVEEMKGNFQTQQDYQGKLDEIQTKYAGDSSTNAGRLYDVLKVQAAIQGNSAEAGARAQAQTDFNEKFNTYTTTEGQLAGEVAKAKKDRGSSYLNTLMTLKKEKEQADAERAQAQLEAAVSMGKQASSDYFKQAGLDLKGQEISLKADTAKSNSELAKQKFLHTIQKDVDSGTINWAKVWLDAKSKGITLPPQFAGPAKAAAPKPRITPQASKKQKYYNPRTGTYYYM